MSTLATELKRSVLKFARNINISEGAFDAQTICDVFETKTIKFCISEKVVSEKEILHEISVRIKEIGRMSFDQHKNAGTDPDHTYSPQTLAYAIVNGEFTEEERKYMKFGRETETAFLTTYLKKDLDQILLTQLQTEKKPVSTNVIGYGHSC